MCCLACAASYCQHYSVSWQADWSEGREEQLALPHLTDSLCFVAVRNLSGDAWRCSGLGLSSAAYRLLLLSLRWLLDPSGEGRCLSLRRSLSLRLLLCCSLLDWMCSSLCLLSLMLHCKLCSLRLVYEQLRPLYR